MILENFYHGSPYEFERFDINRVGSGDSRSKFGWGLYFTDSPDTALKYAQELSIGKLKDTGYNIYEVKLLGLDSFYQWDAEISESLAQVVYSALVKHGHEDSAEQFQAEIQEYGLWTMDSLYQYLEAVLGGKKETSEFLYNICNVNGVIGQTGWLEGNVYVAFSDNNVKIINHMKSDEMNQLDEIRILVRETLEALSEDYPSSFDMKYFKSLKSFAQRIKYCEQFLQRISSGSSRIVYKIDDEKVLKLAKNVKGLSQNEVEISYSQYNDINYIFAKVFDYEDNDLWLEMELARKVSKGDFKRITGFSFEDFCAAIHNYGNQVSSSRSTYTKDVNPEIVAQMWESEFMYPIFNFIGNYDIPVGDLQRLSSYGIVQRDGVDAIVLVDFGLNKDVESSHYSESVEPTQMIDESNDTNLWVYGGIVLIKGKEVDGMQSLYACHIVSLMELGRKKVDNTPGKSAKMVVLDNNIFRIVNDNGQLRALKMDFKNAASLSRTINFNGRQSHAVTLNNQKTPIHWETLKYNNFPQLFKNVGTEIMNMPGIKWTL